LNENQSTPESKGLLETDENYRNLLDNVSDAVITTDTEDIITSWNRSAEKIFGWKAQEVIGKKLSTLIIPPSRQVGIYQLTRDAKTGKVISGIYTVCLRRDRITGINVYLSVFPLKDSKQKIIGLSHILRNMDGQKLSENMNPDGLTNVSKSTSAITTGLKKADELSLENKRFILAGKVESEFLAGLSYELRTQLNSIIGFSELLKQKTTGDLNKKQEQYVDKVLTSGRYLLNNIDNFDLKLIEAGKVQLVIEKITVLETVQGVIDVLKEKASHQKVVIKKELDPQLGFIEADKKWLIQILFNLLNNAVKFSKNEGGIATITAKKAGSIAQFSVADNGIGIREEDMGRLFNKGTGLIISKKLIELHGGELTAESKYGAGSTFTFKLPLVAKRANR
jgi:PAS domain S-box-containing protein